MNNVRLGAALGLGEDEDEALGLVGENVEQGRRLLVLLDVQDLRVEERRRGSESVTSRPLPVHQPTLPLALPPAHSFRQPRSVNAHAG